MRLIHSRFFHVFKKFCKGFFLRLVERIFSRGHKVPLLPKKGTGLAAVKKFPVLILSRKAVQQITQSIAPVKMTVFCHLFLIWIQSAERNPSIQVIN